MTKEEIKPCPYCGAEPEKQIMLNAYRYYCPKDCAENFYQAQEQALKAWNTRA